MGYNQQRYDRWEWELAERLARYGVDPDDDDGYDKLRDRGAFDYERKRYGTLGVTVYAVTYRKDRDNDRG